MSLTLKYQGQEASRNKNTSTYKETYQGSEGEIDAFIAENLSGISQYFQGKGYLTSWRKTNAGGPFYNVEIEYTVNYDGSFNNESQIIYGEKSAQLSIRNLQLPLEKAPKYKAKWNHYLAGLSGQEVPGWWDTTSSIILSGSNEDNYKWLNSYTDKPDVNDKGVKWVILKEPTKPGIEYYDFAYFVVTETAKYGSASAAGNAVSKDINHITSPQNTFGLSGEWKLDEANVQYNGSYWIGTNVYTRAGDSKGWDKDLYGDDNQNDEQNE